MRTIFLDVSVEDNGEHVTLWRKPVDPVAKPLPQKVFATCVYRSHLREDAHNHRNWLSSAWQPAGKGGGWRGVVGVLGAGGRLGSGNQDCSSGPQPSPGGGAD